MSRTRPRSIWSRYGYGWVTAGFFLLSLVGHWVAAWFAYMDEQHAHNQPVAVSGYVLAAARDTLENWQSEFLQLLWQIGGLSFLLYVGSPQSREGDDRKEAKLDEILRRLAPEESEKLITRLDREFPRR